MKKLSKYQCFKAHSGVTVVRREKKYNLQQVHCQGIWSKKNQKEDFSTSPLYVSEIYLNKSINSFQ